MRRHLVLPILLASTLGLAACGEATDTTSPTETATASPTTAPTPSPTATTETEPEPAPTTSDPAATETTPAMEGDCSAAGMSGDGAAFEQLPAEARATAEFLLDAALRCDEQLLATAAAESETTLTFGGADPYEFFGLPEDDERIYSVIVTLLADTTYAAEADDATPATFVWPRVHTGDWADADEAWQEVVDVGLLTSSEADEMRAAGAGYLGWRLGISGDGTWQFFVAGD